MARCLVGQGYRRFFFETVRIDIAGHPPSRRGRYLFAVPPLLAGRSGPTPLGFEVVIRRSTPDASSYTVVVALVMLRVELGKKLLAKLTARTVLFLVRTLADLAELDGKTTELHTFQARSFQDGIFHGHNRRCQFQVPQRIIGQRRER